MMRRSGVASFDERILPLTLALSPAHGLLARDVAIAGGGRGDDATDL
jgi:hypothetical protein